MMLGSSFLSLSLAWVRCCSRAHAGKVLISRSFTGVIRQVVDLGGGCIVDRAHFAQGCLLGGGWMMGWGSGKNGMKIHLNMKGKFKNKKKEY